MKIARKQIKYLSTSLSSPLTRNLNYHRFFSTDKNSQTNVPESIKKDTDIQDISSKKKLIDDEEYDFSKLSFKDLLFVKKKNPDEMIKQPESKTTITFGEESKFKANTDIELQLKDNPLALKILKEGKIDLRDKRINVTSLNITDSSIVDPTIAESLKQINLGDIKVLPKNSVLLDDIDVHNIPDDKDIVIEKEEKVMIAVGRKLDRKKELKIVKDDDESKSDLKNIHDVSTKVYEEKSYHEIKNESLFSFEKDFAEFNFKAFMRSFISKIPFLFLLGYFTETFIEIWTVKKDDRLLEKQEMDGVLELRKQYVRTILLENPLYDRTRILEVSKETS